MAMSVWPCVLREILNPINSNSTASHKSQTEYNIFKLYPGVSCAFASVVVYSVQYLHGDYINVSVRCTVGVPLPHAINITMGKPIVLSYETFLALQPIFPPTW